MTKKNPINGDDVTGSVLPVNKNSKKADLLEYATSTGIAVNKSWAKDKIWEAIESASSTDIVKASGGDATPFLVFDTEDDHQIALSMAGQLADKYVYHFTTKGKELFGLSKVGVEMACQHLLTKYDIAYRVLMAPTIIEDADYIRAVVQVGRFDLRGCRNGNGGREVMLDSAIGSKRQWKKQSIFSGKGANAKRIIVDDPFAFEKAVSKAQRNARLSLIPYPLQLEIIEMFKRLDGGSHVKQIDDRAVRYLTDGQKRFLEATAAEKGIYHKGLHQIVVDKLGYNTLNEVKVGDFDQLKAALMAIETKAVAYEDIPGEVRDGYAILGYSQEKQVQHWTAWIQKQKDPAVAIEKMVKAINEEIDRREL